MANPTINDVARLAGVSKKTVSRVINDSPLLNEATRAKVQQVIAEIGYVPNPQARALALQRGGADERLAPPPPSAGFRPAAPPAAATLPPASTLLALIYNAATLPALHAVQGGLLLALRDTDCGLIVHSLDDGGSPSDSLRDFIERHRPAGLLLAPPLSEQDALAGLATELGCACVRLLAEPEGAGAGVIASADRAAAAQAVAYLIAQGHERIGMVTGPEDSRAAQQRELGYLDAMADHDLDRGPALIAAGDNSFQSGYAAGQLLLEVSPRPTAIFAGNDDMAAGVIHAAARQGIPVPDRLSVIGFEDMQIAGRLCPQLTSVHVPLAEMAYAAGLVLTGRAPAREARVFAPEIIHRASTAPAKG